jgi:hypothetical protein
LLLFFALDVPIPVQKLQENFKATLEVFWGLSGDFPHFYEIFLSFLHQNVYPQFEIKQIFLQLV